MGIMSNGTRRFLVSNYCMCPSIIYDSVSSKLRIWYNQKADLLTPCVNMMHMESDDLGETWSTPQLLRTLSWGFGCSVIDEGSPGPERFKNAYHFQGLGGVDGIYLAISPDGLTWTPTTDPMVRAQWTLAEVGDIVDVWKNPFTGRYGCYCKIMAPDDRRRFYLRLADQFSNPSSWTGGLGTEVPGIGTRVVYPDAMDYGRTEFYGVSGPIAIDGALLFFIRVLRDDYANGVGYTVLGWSFDGGISINRSREPFLVGRPGTPDQAIAWVYGACVHDGTLYLTYSAYDGGHKVGNRAIGFTSMPVSDLRM